MRQQPSLPTTTISASRSTDSIIEAVNLDQPTYFDVEAWAKKTATEDHYFDSFAADRACNFFPRYLRYTKGEWKGKPFILEDWQRAIIRVAFGWKRKSDDTRRFRIIYLELPRKNGKTELAAGIALYLAFCDNEPASEVYSVANNKDQANICFKAAAQMRRASEELSKRTLVAKYSIFNKKEDQSYQVLSSEHGTKDGLSAHGVVYDEFHAFRDRNLYDVMHTSVGARRQPLEIIITTAGNDRHSICYQQHFHAEQVRDGIIADDEFLPIIYAANKDDDITDPRVWAKANPNLGKAVKLEYIRKEAAKAKQQPSYENTFKRLHLNIWTEQATRWLNMDKWDKGGPGKDMHIELVSNHLAEAAAALVGRPCFGGLDFARVSDLTGLSLVFPPLEPTEKWKLLCKFWCPADNITERSRRDRVPYDVWQRYGLITPTEGNVTDYAFVQRDIIELAGLYDMRELAYDRTFFGDIINVLTDEGVPLVAHGQGFLSMGAPTAELERLVQGEKIEHFGHPILRWNASNVAVLTDAAGNIKPDKEKSTEKIDGIVATVMGISRASAHKEEFANLGQLIEEGNAIL